MNAPSPHTANNAHAVHSGVLVRSLWTACALFAVCGLGAFIGLRASLASESRERLAGYSDLVKLAPRPAYVTITLP